MTSRDFEFETSSHDANMFGAIISTTVGDTDTFHSAASVENRTSGIRSSLVR